MSSWKKGPIAWMAKNSVASISNACTDDWWVDYVQGSQARGFSWSLNWISSTSPSCIPQARRRWKRNYSRSGRGRPWIGRGETGDESCRRKYGERHSRTPIGLRHAENGSDIKNAVDQIQSFPVDAERPTVQLISCRKEVISIALHGEVPRDVLKVSAEDIRTDLQNYKEITQVGIDGVITDEISIEIDKETLRAHGLSLRVSPRPFAPLHWSSRREESRQRKVKFCFGPTSESESDRSSSPSKSFRVPMDKSRTERNCDGPG